MQKKKIRQHCVIYLKVHEYHILNALTWTMSLASTVRTATPTQYARLQTHHTDEDKHVLMKSGRRATTVPHQARWWHCVDGRGTVLLKCSERFWNKIHFQEDTYKDWSKHEKNTLHPSIHTERDRQRYLFDVQRKFATQSLESSIVADCSHPGHGLFKILPSGRRYRAL